MTHLEHYDLLWQLISAEGRQPALFGEHCSRLARAACAASACGSVMPVVYLEIPLAKDPGFDLQVCIDRSALEKGYRLPDEAPPRERELLAWLAGPSGTDCTGVDLAFDLRANGIASPQLIVLMSDGTLADAEGFFSLAGAPDGAARYRAAEARIPAGWHSWYTGIMPGRPGAPVRLDVSVSRRKVASYRTDPSLLARDLAQMGYELSSREADWCERLIQLPCGLNLQLDALDDGSIGPVLGYNLIEGSIGPQQTRQRMTDGWMRDVLQLAEDWGLADERWHLLKDLCWARMLIVPDSAGNTHRLVASAKVTFIKVRMTPETLLDAKAYLMCTVHDIDERETTR